MGETVPEHFETLKVRLLCRNVFISLDNAKLLGGQSGCPIQSTGWVVAGVWLFPNVFTLHDARKARETSQLAPNQTILLPFFCDD